MAKYDASKRYSWTPKDTFELSGAEFGLILNALRSILNTEEAAKILLASEANNAIENVLAKAVEADIAKEAEETPVKSLKSVNKE